MTLHICKLLDLLCLNKINRATPKTKNKSGKVGEMWLPENPK